MYHPPLYPQIRRLGQKQDALTLLIQPIVLVIVLTMLLNWSVVKVPMVDSHQEYAKRICLTNLPLLLPLKSMTCGIPIMILHGQLVNAPMYAHYPSLLAAGQCTQASLSAARWPMEAKRLTHVSTVYPSHPLVLLPNRED